LGRRRQGANPGRPQQSAGGPPRHGIRRGIGGVIRVIAHRHLSFTSRPQCATIAVDATWIRQGRSAEMTVPPKDSSTKQTIALVDDDRNILTSVCMTLEQEGFQVRTYTDGESALQG